MLNTLHPSKIIIRFSMVFSMVFSLPAPTDERQVFNQQSPAYLSAIGKLIVPSERTVGGEHQNFIEECSATLLSDRLYQQRWIMTAWHCIEHYHNLGRSILFRIMDEHGEWHERDAHIVIHGGSISEDWALLRTETALPKTLHSLAIANYQPGRVIIAGFSGDEGLGQNGNVLTFQDNCVSSEQTLDDAQISVNCWAFKGASGGAVIQHEKLVGIVSQGDNAGTASFVDLARYAGRVMRELP